MVVLGIDPGTRKIGYGVVRREGIRFALLAAGTLMIRAKDDALALFETKRGVDALIRKWRPDALGIEKIYFARNQKTAMAVAQARGVVVLSAVERSIPFVEFSPNEIKAAMTGYGLADKRSVIKMVRLSLGSLPPSLTDDAADAVAIAIVLCSRRRIGARPVPSEDTSAKRKGG